MIVYIIYKIYAILYIQNYIVEKVKNYSLNLLKNIHVVTTSSALRAIFRRQPILYKTLETFNKPVEYCLHRIILTNRAIT